MLFTIVSAGVLVLAPAFVVIITLLRCCLLYNKNKLLSASHPTTNENEHISQLVNNVAYGCNDGIELVNNGAYNRSSNSQMVNNQAYNISDNDEPYYCVIEVKS